MDYISSIYIDNDRGRWVAFVYLHGVKVKSRVKRSRRSALVALLRGRGYEVIDISK